MNFFKYTKKNKIGTLTISLPKEKVNILRSDVLAELDKSLNEICLESLDALLIRSDKEKIFIAGADVNEIKDIYEESDAKSKAKQGQFILNKLAKLPFPTIAVIHGACLGGGLELALACDYRIATDDVSTKLGLPETTLGIIPGFGGTQRLPKLIGTLNSLSLILPGKVINGKKALRLKLVDECLPLEYLDFKLPQIIQSIIAGGKKYKDKRQKKTFIQKIENFPIVNQFLFKKVKKELIKKTKGHYPAPISALKVIQKTQGMSLKKGLEIEASFFSKLAPSIISKNLIHLFFVNEQIKKEKGVANNVSPLAIHQVAVLGAGIMGGGIAWLFSKMDILVRMKDLNWEAIKKGYQQASKIYQFLQKIRKYSSREVSLKMDKISGTIDYSGFQNVDIVVEAVVEDIKIKKTVFNELEKNIRSTTIIASNTSSLSINEMASVFKKPERFIGMHFFNPVNRMQLVEVISGNKTSQKTIATVVKLAKDAGKIPIVVKDCPGFLVNRILLPYINEAGFLLEDGAAINQIDKSMENFGMPMGPLTLLDEVGIDVGYKVAVILEKGYGSRMKVCSSFEKLYSEKKLLGKKTGKGIYLHQGKIKKINPAILSLNKRKNKRLNSKEDIFLRPLLIMINEAARCLEEKIVKSPEYLDMAMITGTGFPPFRGGLLKYADHLGADKIVEKLEFYSNRLGERFQPANLLIKLSGEKRKFYQK